MKRTVLILAALLLIGGIVFLFGMDSRIRTVPLESIPLETASAGGSASAGAQTDADLLLTLSYEGVTLPVNEDGTVLIPVIPETGLTVTCEKGAGLSATESVLQSADTSYRSIRITVSKGNRSRALTLTETNMAVALLELELTGITKESDPIQDKKRTGTLRLFSIDENGGLRYETGTVSAKLRGASSRGYKKKSYTLTNLDASGDPVARSLMGLPADAKFGLNSMYEDDVKIRDVLSLNIFASMQPANSPAIQMRHCELYIDGVYWGLYGFQQVVSAASLGLQPEDGLLKILSDFSISVLKNRRVRAADVVQAGQSANVAYEFLDALACLAEKQPDALGRFDVDSLYRYALFIQLIAGGDSTMKNIVAILHADTGRFSLCAYDTDQSFGLTWDNDCAPLYMGIHTGLAHYNLLKGDYSPWSGLLSLGDDVTRPLAELWFGLRKDALSEETLLTSARQLFDLVTDSGAREREHARWPKGNYAATGEQIETFLTERLAWCDTFFWAYMGSN